MINYIIDTHPFGSTFKNMIRGYFVNSQAIDKEAIVEYVFRESTNQIVNIVKSEQSDFMLNLLCLPNFQYFDGIDIFTVFEPRQAFTKAFQEYGMSLWFRLFQQMQLRSDKEYMASIVTEHYIVIGEE